MNSQNITDINIVRLSPHPNNPRKDLGDLTELAESIKVNGILQNLTVVKDEEPSNNGPQYKVIIGHRRLAAAELAGLEIVPCTIAEMNPEEQISTMLCENLQRADLTPLEQAKGFQMMMDLGDTVQGIADKSGFSEQTVSHRLEIAKLSDEAINKSEENGITLMDFAFLEKVKNVKKREKLLKENSHSNFVYSVEQAVKEELITERTKDVRKVLKELTESKDSKYNYGAPNGFVIWKSFNLSADKAPVITLPKDTKGWKYAIRGYRNNDLEIFKPAKKQELTKKELEEKEKEKVFKGRVKAIKELNALAFSRRMSFMKELLQGSGGQSLKEHEDEILRAQFEEMVDRLQLDEDILASVLGIEHEQYTALDKEEFEKHTRDFSIRKLAALFLYALLDGNDDVFFSHIYGYEIRPTKWFNYADDGLEKVLSFLELLGYKPMDWEKLLYDGTHELYDQPEKE